MPTSPFTEQSDLVSFEIFSNGKPINDTIQVLSIEVQLKSNGIDKSIITILDGNVFKGTFDVLDSNTFEIGANIEVKLGYHARNDSVFKGIVTEQKIIINEEYGSALQVCCMHHDDQRNALQAQISDIPKIAELKVTFGEDILESELNINIEDPANIHGSISFQGSAKAMVNDTIEINGFGSRFSNKSLISEVVHHLKQGNWQTTIKVGNTQDI
jgi:phage protein D